MHRRFYRGEVPAHIGVMISPVKCLHARGEFGFVRCDSPLALLKVYSKVGTWCMVRYELQRLHGAPLQRGTVDAGTTLVSLLDSLQLHRDVIVKLNGRALPDDYDISRPLRSGDTVAVFDQPEGGVGKLITTMIASGHENPLRRAEGVRTVK